MAPTSPRLSQAPQTPELWLAQHQNSHPSCPKAAALPAAPGQRDPSGKHRQDGHPANIHLERSVFPLPLEKIQLFLSLVCYEDPPLPPKPCCSVAFSLHSKMFAECLKNIYIPPLLQRYAPDTSILWAGSALGPWTGPSSHVSSILNKCHETLSLF